MSSAALIRAAFVLATVYFVWTTVTAVAPSSWWATVTIGAAAVWTAVLVYVFVATHAARPRHPSTVAARRQRRPR